MCYRRCQTLSESLRDGQIYSRGDHRAVIAEALVLMQQRMRSDQCEKRGLLALRMWTTSGRRSSFSTRPRAMSSAVSA